MAIRFPDFRSQADLNPERMREFIKTLEHRLAIIERPFGKGYVLEGTVDGTKTLNVDTATDAEIRQFLGSLVTDLQNRNLLRGDQ